MKRNGRFLAHKGAALGIAGVAAALGAGAAWSRELSDRVEPGVFAAVGTIGPYASALIYPALERLRPGQMYGKRFRYRQYLSKMFRVNIGFGALSVAYAPVKYYAMSLFESSQSVFPDYGRIINTGFWASLAPDMVLLPAYLAGSFFLTKRSGVFEDCLETRLKAYSQPP